MNLALFDFDGTISENDTFSDFIRVVVSRRITPARHLLLGPLVAGYRLGLLSATRTRVAAARLTFRGEPVTHIRTLGTRYAASVMPGTIRRRAMERIGWHQRHGDEVVIVSASLDVYLRPWCEEAGVSCICTELEERNERLTGRYHRGDCTGPEKARRIRERYDLARYTLIDAYGDTSEDREMLALAHRKHYRWEEIGDGREVRGEW